MKKLIKPLQEQGRFKSPEEVDKYFEEALNKAYKMGWHAAIDKLVEELKNIELENHDYDFQQGYLATVKDIIKFNKYKPDEPQF